MLPSVHTDSALRPRWKWFRRFGAGRKTWVLVHLFNRWVTLYANVAVRPKTLWLGPLLIEFDWHHEVTENAH